jgi:RNase H-fold protein (predicted Holliday junction resolvase)
MLVQAHQLVGRIPVYRTLVGVVAFSESLIGVAVSDPYLSCARPVHSVTYSALTTSLPKLVAEHKAGAFVVGLPFAASGLRAEHRARQQRLLAQLIKQSCDLEGTQLMACSYAASPQHTADSVASSYRDNLLWDQTAVDELGVQGASRDASIHAAVALQLFLDEHSGGWANTFG